jgi:hypothetical protein
MTVSNNISLHGDITLQTSDDIGGLLLLVPTDNGVEHQNTDNDTEIDPVLETSCKQDGEFHGCVRVSLVRGLADVDVFTYCTGWDL